MEKSTLLRSEMERHYRAWQQSGASRKAYSDSQGLSYHRFLYWIKKFAAAEPGEDGFTEVSLPIGAYPCPQVEIEYPSGQKVRLYHAAPAALIKSLL